MGNRFFGFTGFGFGGGTFGGGAGGEGLFADAVAEIVEFGPADGAFLFESDFGNHGSVHRPNAFDADIHVGQFTDAEGFTATLAGDGYKHAFKDLEAGFVVFDDFLGYGNGVADAESLVTVNESICHREILFYIMGWRRARPQLGGANLRSNLRCRAN